MSSLSHTRPQPVNRNAANRTSTFYGSDSGVGSFSPSHPPSNAPPGSLGDPSRARQSKKDEAIRNRIQADLAKKRPGHPSQIPQSSRRGGGGARRRERPVAGTVSALKPLPALTVPDTLMVSDASQLCAAKRTDCVLVVDEEEHLCGIFTAKDLAFRVVGEGLDPRNTPVSTIMTRNPMVTRDTTSATEALQTMVTRGFRHLPVCNEEGDVVGLLDITKVFHESLEKLERAANSSQKLYTALEGVQTEFGAPSQANASLMSYVEALREKMSFPDLGSILDARTGPATVGVKTTVREAARLMKEHHTTAVCVMEQEGRKLAGIFTSKDVVLRVIAAGLDARTCSVVRVMTPHPDTAQPSLSIQQALRKMHDGHYLNLPVLDDTGALVGIVDVLKLTYATLEQINSIGGDGSGSEQGGPVWSKFFASFGGSQHGGEDSESVVSDHLPEVPTTPARERLLRSEVQNSPISELAPGDSASLVGGGAHDESMLGSRMIGAAGPVPTQDDGTYLFKFSGPGGSTHRFSARYDNYENLRDIVAGKLLSDDFFSSPPAEGEDERDPSDFHLCYLDDDGDLVVMTGDQDVGDAVKVVRKQGKDRVVLHLKGGKGWGNVGEATKSQNQRKATLETVLADPPSAKVVDGEQVFGVPKDLILPGAIVFLGVVIAVTFAVGRSSNR
ncbi:CBS-domain-containing protein [Atractiella rhizophila]|nr:CBS-domain-containing protein [Atractiella rhizophila]